MEGLRCADLKNPPTFNVNSTIEPVWALVPGRDTSHKICQSTAKPPYNGHVWDQIYCPLWRGVRLMEVVFNQTKEFWYKSVFSVFGRCPLSRGSVVKRCPWKRGVRCKEMSVEKRCPLKAQAPKLDVDSESPPKAGVLGKETQRN